MRYLYLHCSCIQI